MKSTLSFSSQKKQATKAEPSPARRRDEDVVRPPNLDSLPKILFTGLDEDEGAAQAKIVDNLGGEVVEDWRACTHLVMDKKIKRTIKFLCALGKGKSIVGVDWLEACKKSGTFVGEFWRRSWCGPRLLSDADFSFYLTCCQADESKYVVRDNEFEKRMGFSLEESIKLAKTKPILQGWSFYNAAHNVKPAPQDMKEVIEAAGGQVSSTLVGELLHFYARASNSFAPTTRFFRRFRTKMRRTRARSLFLVATRTKLFASR